MKKERFFRLLGDLDDHILDKYREMDAQLSHKALRKKRALRALIIAACLALLIGACVPVGMMIAKWMGDRPVGPWPGPDPWGESGVEHGTDEPPQQDISVTIRSLEELEKMREMVTCEDEQVLQEYLHSISGGGAQSRQDLIDFLNLVDKTPYAPFIDGEITDLTYNKTDERFSVSIEEENGESMYVSYELGMTDVEKNMEKAARKLGRKNLLSAPLSGADGRLTLYTETREPSANGDVIRWQGVLDGIAVYIVYRVADADRIDTAALVGSLEVADSIAPAFPQYTWSNTTFGAFVDSPKRYICSFVDSPDSEFATGNLLDIYADWYKDPSAPETITIVYRGQEYSLSYSHSKTMAWKSMQACHEYTCKDVKGLMVSIDQVTGEIVRFDFFAPPEADAEELPMEQLEEIAYAFLAEKVSDPKAYRLETPKQDGEEVSYTFVRYLGELPTSDRVELLLTTRGDVIAYGLGYLGAMRNALPIPDSLIQIVNNELGRFVSRDGECGIERVILTPTGQLALDCYIDNGDDGAHMLFYITEPIE